MAKINDIYSTYSDNEKPVVTLSAHQNAQKLVEGRKVIRLARLTRSVRLTERLSGVTALRSAKMLLTS